MIKNIIFFVMTLSLTFTVLLSGGRFAEASDPKPIHPTQKVPPLKDDIDNMMQQRAVQRGEPKPQQDTSTDESPLDTKIGEEAPEQGEQEATGQEPTRSE